VTGNLPRATGYGLVWALVAVLAGVMILVCLAGWDVLAAACWTLLLLVSVVAWLLVRVHSRRSR
jgi:hypothetical protein